MTPFLRDTAHIDIVAYIRGIIRKLQDERNFPYRNCLNCIHFIEETEICKLANQRPPAKIIAYGCDSHDDKEIPF